MSSVPKITAEQARNDSVISDALLICAYDSPEKFQRYHLDGARSLQDFRPRSRPFRVSAS